MHIDHAAINVSDLEAMKVFFERYFNGRANEGYHNPRTGLRTYFITFPDGGARLELMHWPEMTVGTQAAHPVGYCHMAMSVGSCEAVDRLSEQLVADGYRCVSGPRLTGDGCYECCIELPDGIELEITI